MSKSRSPTHTVSKGAISSSTSISSHTRAISICMSGNTLGVQRRRDFVKTAKSYPSLRQRISNSLAQRAGPVVPSIDQHTDRCAAPNHHPKTGTNRSAQARLDFIAKIDRYLCIAQSLAHRLGQRVNGIGHLLPIDSESNRSIDLDRQRISLNQFPSGTAGNREDFGLGLPSSAWSHSTQRAHRV